jgi:hypothetical protein
MELSIFSDEFISNNYYNIVLLYFTISLIDKICDILARNGLAILNVYKLYADLDRRKDENLIVKNLINTAIGFTPYLNMIAIISIFAFTIISELLLADKKAYETIKDRIKQKRSNNQ